MYYTEEDVDCVSHAMHCIILGVFYLTNQIALTELSFTCWALGTCYSVYTENIKG